MADDVSVDGVRNRAGGAPIWQVRGVFLPEARWRDLWLAGGRVTFQRPAGATEVLVDDGWILPALVDAHTHPGHLDDWTFTGGAFEAECGEHAAAGVGAIRVLGTTARVPEELKARPGLPRVIAAGAWLAWSGLRSADSGCHRQVDDLVGSAVAEMTGNDGWCKVIADWEPDRPPVPVELLTAAVAAVHGAGGRIAAYCQTADGCRVAVESGVDSIEHGTHLDPALLDRMAAQHTALVPTFTPFLRDIARARADAPSARRDWFVSGFDAHPGLVRSAHEAGVAVFAGTDSTVFAPTFGDIGSEVAWLVRSGLPAVAALGAASWDARSWLGLPGLVEGASADLVAYDEDPRVDIGVLGRPRRVVLGGQIVAAGRRGPGADRC